MRLLIDASSINRKNVLASIPNYILRLIDGFLAYSSYEIILLVDNNFKDFFENKFPTITKHYLQRNYLLYRLPFLGEIYGRRKYKNAIAKISYDIEIIASDQDRSTRIKPNHPRILVIHDLKSIKDGRFIQKKRDISFYLFLINTAHSIVAISDYTKNDLIKNFGVNKDKISIIPNSVALSSAKEMPKFEIPDNYILYVNTLLPHKNPITLIKAYERIHNQINHKIIFVGKTTTYWTKKIVPYIRKHGLQNNIIHLQDLEVKELQFLYSNASLFVTTSKREGFGYTPIEAALSNVPVISSTSEALPFSTQGLLNYYDPADDSNALAKKMFEVLNSPPNKEKLGAIAKRFKEIYSPKKQVERFSELIQGLNI